MPVPGTTPQCATAHATFCPSLLCQKFRACSPSSLFGVKGTFSCMLALVLVRSQGNIFVWQWGSVGRSLNSLGVLSKGFSLAPASPSHTHHTHSATRFHNLKHYPRFGALAWLACPSLAVLCLRVKLMVLSPRNKVSRCSQATANVLMHTQEWRERARARQ